MVARSFRFPKSGGSTPPPQDPDVGNLCDEGIGKLGLRAGTLAALVRSAPATRSQQLFNHAFQPLNAFFPDTYRFHHFLESDLMCGVITALLLEPAQGSASASPS